MTPAVSPNGKIVWLDNDGNRDFSPATKIRIQTASIVLLALVLSLGLATLTGKVPAMPWSPVGQFQQEKNEAPKIEIPPLPPGWKFKENPSQPSPNLRSV